MGFMGSAGFNNKAGLMLFRVELKDFDGKV